VPSKPAVWPVGRLDKNTEGLMILTNDGTLTQRITHPKFKTEKEYCVSTSRPLDKTAIKTIQNGIMLNDRFVKPDKFSIVSPGLYRIVLHSGRKRIIRRLIEKTGGRVTKLKRIRINFLTLENLAPGKWAYAGRKRDHATFTWLNDACSPNKFYIFSIDLLLKDSVAKFQDFRAKICGSEKAY